MRLNITHVLTWCIFCRTKTAHTYRLEVQGTTGTVWKCDRCQRTKELSTYRLSTAERVNG